MEAEYGRLKAEWTRGNCDREQALRLLFLAWMHWADPSFVTEMEDDGNAHELWHAIFDHFQGEDAWDAEFLYVAALMADIAPWGIGDDDVWRARAAQMSMRSLKLKPEGFSPKTFEGRGEYGEYFAHHTRRQGE